MNEWKPIPVELDRCGVCLAPETEAEKASQELFTTNLHFLYAHRERICQDPKMSAAPVATGHNLAFVGSWHLQDATLATVLRWMEICPEAIRKDREGRMSLMYFFCGNPLSGTNECCFIGEDGSRFSAVLTPFRPVWSTFLEVNSRSGEREEAPAPSYSLEEVLKILAQ